MKRFLLVVMVLLVVCFGGVYAYMENAAQDWNLILVNAEHPIPKHYDVELVTLANGHRVDERIYPDLQQMFDDMRAQGVYPYVGSGYRTWERQQELMDEKIQAYVDEGYGEAEAKALAEQWVAKPGTSEHQLGIAIDVNHDPERSTREEVYGWLAENAYRYGFIQRYTAEKQAITGIIPEPWHYRYVGKEAAREIYTLGICLEEYLNMLEMDVAA